MRRVYRFLVLFSLVLAACDSARVAPPAPKLDPTAAPWYRATTDDLAALNRQAKQLLQQRKSDEAASLIVKGQTLSSKLLSVPQPTFDATIAASDLDDLYARMLFSNRNYGWSRMFFQKNLVRWKYWKPQTADTAVRLKRAQSAIEECDRRIARESVEAPAPRR